jgi:hypothetical protein
MDNLAWPWMVEIGFISYRDFAQKKRPPLPSEFLATFVVFGGLTLVSRANARVASLLGWGFVVATALNVFNPKPTSLSDLVKPVSSSTSQKGAVA